MLTKEQAIINAVDVDELSEARDMITSNLFERVYKRIEGLKESIRLLEDEQDDDDTEYQKFFRKALEKFGVSSPDEFENEEKKKEFFDYVDKEWKGDEEKSESAETESAT